jgi:hypothetical protein
MSKDQKVVYEFPKVEQQPKDLHGNKTTTHPVVKENEMDKSHSDGVLHCGDDRLQYIGFPPGRPAESGFEQHSG